MARLDGVVAHVLQNKYYNVTSPFGYRKDPFNSSVNEFHNGVDLTGKNGAADYVLAFADGIVTYARNFVQGKTSTYPAGNYVVIQHENGYLTRYLHMAYNTVRVKTGERVKKGEVIGYMGTTGSSTGVHLHFEVRLNNTPVDPVPFLLGQAAISNDTPGDLDGDGVVDSFDALLLKKHILGNRELTEDQLKKADANQDGEIDSLDYLEIKRNVIKS